MVITISPVPVVPSLRYFRYLSGRCLVYLAANSISGPVPLELGNAPALFALDLAGNRFSGDLPATIWNLCDRATELRLHGNALTGAVPEPAGPNTTCDRLLDLGANRFSDAFLVFVTAFRGLQRLDLGANRLEGPIPEALSGMAATQQLQALNVSYNFSGQLPPSFAASRFTADSFVGNDPALCGPPMRQCVTASGLSSRGVAGMVIGIMAGAVVLASVSIGWAQGRWRRNGRTSEQDEMLESANDAQDASSEGRLVVFEGGEHLTLEEVLNTIGQVVDKASYCTVYKAKLARGSSSIELRLLREGSCKDAASCAPVVRRIGRACHENLVPLRAFYQRRRGEKLLVYGCTVAASPRRGGQRSQWGQRHKIALGAARALAYLHAGHGEAHENVRSSIVVVDDLFVARLAEYAVDRLLVPAAAEAVLAATKMKGRMEYAKETAAREVTIRRGQDR